MEIDVLIVGAGPAGTSTALHLLQRNPTWAARILILDKARHPRPKLCGGGLTAWGERTLRNLGLDVPVPHVEVHEARFTYGDCAFAYWGRPLLRIVRRDEFDAWLCRCVKERGGRVSEGEGVLDVRAETDAARVITSVGEYRAKVLVAADGSKSLVRRKLGFDDETGVARLLEVLTPEDAARSPEFVESRACFDFSPLRAGVQGYYWDFPSLIEGRAFMNRGIYDSRADPAAPRARLKSMLAAELERRGRPLSGLDLQGHPIRWFDPRASFSRPRVLLVGDAAGVDPLFGEGIGYALAYGRVAAQAIEAAFARAEFSFRDYRRRLLLDWVGRDLVLRWIGAGVVYRITQRRAAAQFLAKALRSAMRLLSPPPRARPSPLADQTAIFHIKP